MIDEDQRRPRHGDQFGAQMLYEAVHRDMETRSEPSVRSKALFSATGTENEDNGFPLLQDKRRQGMDMMMDMTVDMTTDKWGKRVPFEWELSEQQDIREKLVGVRQLDECELLRSKGTDRKLVRKFVDELDMRIGLGAFAALQHYVE